MSIKPHEIYVGASYRIRGCRGVIEIREIDTSHVSYRSQDGSMIGSSPVDQFCNDLIERVFPHKPQVSDALELLRRMAPEQRMEVARELSRQAAA